MSSSKRNINTATNLLQAGRVEPLRNFEHGSADKEDEAPGSSTTLSDKERRYLFIEYQALHDEINRIALWTDFNGIPLLNGDDPAAPEELVLQMAIRIFG